MAEQAQGSCSVVFKAIDGVLPARALQYMHGDAAHAHLHSQTRGAQTNMCQSMTFGCASFYA